MKYTLDENEYRQYVLNKEIIEYLGNMLSEKYTTLKTLRSSENPTIYISTYDSSIDKISGVDFEILKAFNQNKNSGYYYIRKENE